MTAFDGATRPHRRFNPLTREWILVSPHRTQRPWQRQVEATAPRDPVQYDPACYMWPANTPSAGASNPHPHCQIWSSASIPNIPKIEQESQDAYRKAKGSCLLCDYFRLEESATIRTVVQNEHFLAVVPYWAVWPFETMILSKRHG